MVTSVPAIVDLGAHGGPDHAERLVLGSGGPHRYRGSKLERVALPRLDLRLIDEKGGVGDLDLTWPRISGDAGRRGGRRARLSQRRHDPAEGAPEAESEDSHERADDLRLLSSRFGSRR